MNYENLNTEMKCSILSNPIGDLLILHDYPLRSDIQWVEFSVYDLALMLVHEDGTSQSLGIQIETGMAMNIKKGSKVQLALLQNQKVVAVKNTSIVIQDY